MIPILARFTAALLIPLFCASWAVPSDKPKCAECGMMVDLGSPFSAQIVEAKSTLHFCDIGDLLIHLKDKKRPATGARVKDYSTGEWLEASAALYVHAPKAFHTPMGWSVAAFRDREKASVYGSPLDLAGITAALK